MLADWERVAIGTSYVIHGLHVPTLPGHRGRGAWHGSMRRRLATFPSLPAMGLISDHSRSPAEGLWFLPLARWTVWLRDRPGLKVDPLRSTDGSGRATEPGERPDSSP